MNKRRRKKTQRINKHTAIDTDIITNLFLFAQRRRLFQQSG